MLNVLEMEVGREYNYGMDTVQPEVPSTFPGRNSSLDRIISSLVFVTIKVKNVKSD